MGKELDEHGEVKELESLDVEKNEIENEIKNASKPVWRSPIKDHSKSDFCDCMGNTVIITDFEYIASLEIQVQDIQNFCSVF